MGPNPNVTCCGFQVPRPKSQLMSRHQFVGRDSFHMSRHQFSCRDINLSPCWFQLIACGVVTSRSCRDIHLSPLQSSAVDPDVATSECCRDIASCLLQPFTGGHDVATSFLLSRQQLLVLRLRTGVSRCRDISL